MPPKKRKAAAATAEPASMAPKRATRGNIPPEDTAASARPRRGAAAAPSVPELATRPAKKTRGGATKDDAPEATATTGRRGRASAKHTAGDHAEEDDVAADAQLNEDLEETVEAAAAKKNKGGRPRKNAKTAIAASAPEQEPEPEAPKRKGRNAKNAAPVTEERPVEPPKRRGRGKAAAEDVASALEVEKPTGPPKRRDRGKVAAEDVASAPEVEKAAEAPLQRGRGKKQTTDSAPGPEIQRPARGRHANDIINAHDVEPLQTASEAPRQRGRPKKAATAPKEKTENKLVKRGRAKATETQPNNEKAPVKRRRGREVSVAPEEHASKRARTATKPAEEKKEEAPKGTRAQAAAKNLAMKTAETKKAASRRGKAIAKADAKKPAKASVQDEKHARSIAASEKDPKKTATTKKTAATKLAAAEKPVASRKRAQAQSTAKKAASKTTAKPKGRGKGTINEDASLPVASKPAGQMSPEVRIPVKRRRATDHEVDNVELPAPKRLSRHEGMAQEAKPVGGPSRGRKSQQTVPAYEDSEMTDTMATLPTKAYWLMKAEPESRLENGVDVKFSIDDLAAKSEPEPWDGVRNHVAKKNMMAMERGDLAFFYHSSCKEPGVVGVMEIVEGPQPDESAFDPAHPYYDPKSKRERPTWYCVKVAFRSKFTNPERVTLSKLKELKNRGGTPIDDIQLLNTTRLSVTRVLPREWQYILELAGEKEPKCVAGSNDRQESSAAVLERVIDTDEAPDAGEGAAMPGAQDTDMVDAPTDEQTKDTDMDAAVTLEQPIGATLALEQTTNTTSGIMPAVQTMPEKTETSTQPAAEQSVIDEEIVENRTFIVKATEGHEDHPETCNDIEVQKTTVTQTITIDGESEAAANVAEPADSEMQPEDIAPVSSPKQAESIVAESVPSVNFSRSSGIFPSSLAHSVTEESPAVILAGVDEDLPSPGVGLGEAGAARHDQGPPAHLTVTSHPVDHNGNRYTPSKSLSIGEQGQVPVSAQNQAPVQSDAGSTHKDCSPVTGSKPRETDRISANREPELECEDDSQAAAEHMGEESIGAGDYHTGFGSALDAGQSTTGGDDTAADMERALLDQTWHSISEDAGFV